MSSNLKRDQLPPKQVNNWRANFNEEKKLSFNLNVPKIILQKETYKLLAGENENRIRIYLGIESEEKEGNFTICAFAVSAFLLGSGDVYVDYETPVFKLSKENQNYSDNTDEVVESIKKYQRWRKGELNPDDKFAEMRKYIYPKAYLFTKYELHEIFNVENKKEAEISFGIAKTMNVILYSDVKDSRTDGDTSEAFDFAHLCPPYCDEGSKYNSQ